VRRSTTSMGELRRFQKLFLPLVKLATKERVASRWRHYEAAEAHGIGFEYGRSIHNLTLLYSPLMPTTERLVIEHIQGQFPAKFKLTLIPDGKSAPPVEIRSPYEFPVVGRLNSYLMLELRWYFEDFFDYPFPPETTHAENVLGALKAWGEAAFNCLFDHPEPLRWFAETDALQVRSNEPSVLSWPWEVLCDPQGAYVARERQIERSLGNISYAPPLTDMPKDRVNILLVVARPYDCDVRYRSIARPLVGMIQSEGLPAHVEVLRPPTFDRLLEHLRERPGYYHVLHFDGHVAYGESVDGFSPDRSIRRHQGCLVFEDQTGRPDAKFAPDLSALLLEYAPPAIVLNVSLADMLDATATGESPITSVATVLLRSGTRSVVALMHSPHVSGTRVFLPAFYKRLCQAGSVAEAVRAGRQQMFVHRDRVCVRGRYPMEDWLLPVLYQHDPVDFEFAFEIKAGVPPNRESVPRLPAEVTDYDGSYAFVGRDGPLFKMESALHRQAPSIVIHGVGGVGKSTLACGFLRWLNKTGGLDGALWFDFRDIRTAESVINRTGERFYGEQFSAAPNKLELLAEALDQERVLMVWDNFDAASQNIRDPELNGFRAELGLFLDAIRGRLGKVIITSRSREEWLGADRRFELRLTGLVGEECWEYCEAILHDLGPKVNQNDPELKSLMDELAGHPLAMRLALSRVDKLTAGRIAMALRSNLAELGFREREEQSRLFAMFRFIEHDLAESLQPLLKLLCLHERYVDANLLELMAKRVHPDWTRPRIDGLMEELEAVELLRDAGQGTYEINRLLTSYLRLGPEAPPEACERAFVHVMGGLRDDLSRRTILDQSIVFLRHNANFYFTLSLAERLSKDEDFALLAQSLAGYALRCRNFPEARRLLAQLANHSATRGKLELEAAVYHQLGRIAQEVRDFATARVWYLKSLIISEERGIQPFAARSYYQLGRVAQEERDFATARVWYLRCLVIWEKQGNLRGAALTYHNLGAIAQQEADLTTARDWYLKSLAISEQQGIQPFAASTYHQLGMISEEERNFATARDLYLKSLAIEEKLGNLRGVAVTCGQLGILAGLEGNFLEAGKFLIRCISSFLQVNDQPSAKHCIDAFLTFYQDATDNVKVKFEDFWNEAGLGPFLTRGGK
jgi:tetratricopeptide (TPR) repeat protein